MHKLRLILLVLFITSTACDVNKSEGVKSVEGTKVSVKLTKIEETKSKTEKRDSSDQTASYLEKPKDEPFRPIYRPHFHEAPNFRPTTVRYVAAEAAPQSYYEKSELVGGIQYATPGGGGSSHNAAAGAVQQPNLSGGIHYAPSGYRVQPQQQAHSTQAAHAHLPQQVKITAAVSSPPSPQYYAYAEPEMNYLHERLPLHLHQSQRVPPPPPPQHQQQQQHQIQYIIAIPLSYARQLQQQLSGIPTHASQAYALPASAHQAPAPLPHPMMLQAIGPLARDHQGAYRPYHQHYNAASNTDVEAAPAPPGYTTQYLQIPAGVLLAAAQAATRQQRPPPYQPLYYMPQHHAQPMYQQHYQQPQQLQPFYAHYVQQQSAPLQQPQQQHQLKQQQQQPTVVRIGGLKPSDKLSPPHISSSATPAAGATASSPHHSAAASPTPIMHYNPYYVQAPPPPQEHQQQPSFIGDYNYARYVQDQHGSTAAHPLIRLSSPSALLTPHSAAHYYHPMSVPLNYAAPAPPSYVTHENSGSVSAAPLPYFYHPSGIHYGTHLYHPPTPTTHSKTLEASVGNQQQHHQHQQQQQQQQQPRQQQLQQQYQPHATSSSTATTITNGAAPSVAPTVVKYP